MSNTTAAAAAAAATSMVTTNNSSVNGSGGGNSPSLGIWIPRPPSPLPPPIPPSLSHIVRVGDVDVNSLTRALASLDCFTIPKTSLPSSPSAPPPSSASATTPPGRASLTLSMPVPLLKLMAQYAMYHWRIVVNIDHSPHQFHTMSSPLVTLSMAATPPARGSFGSSNIIGAWQPTSQWTPVMPISMPSPPKLPTHSDPHPNEHQCHLVAARGRNIFVTDRTNSAMLMYVPPSLQPLSAINKSIAASTAAAAASAAASTSISNAGTPPVPNRSPMAGTPESVSDDDNDSESDSDDDDTIVAVNGEWQRCGLDDDDDIVGNRSLMDMHIVPGVIYDQAPTTLTPTPPPTTTTTTTSLTTKLSKESTPLSYMWDGPSTNNSLVHAFVPPSTFHSVSPYIMSDPPYGFPSASMTTATSSMLSSSSPLNILDAPVSDLRIVMTVRFEQRIYCFGSPHANNPRKPSSAYYDLLTNEWRYIKPLFRQIHQAITIPSIGILIVSEFGDSRCYFYDPYSDNLRKLDWALPDFNCRKSTGRSILQWIDNTIMIAAPEQLLAWTEDDDLSDDDDSSGDDDGEDIKVGPGYKINPGTPAIEQGATKDVITCYIIPHHMFVRAAGSVATSTSSLPSPASSSTSTGSRERGASLSSPASLSRERSGSTSVVLPQLIKRTDWQRIGDLAVHQPPLSISSVVSCV
jgi:hypothetical protein